jgi:TIR domain
LAGAIQSVDCVVLVLSRGSMASAWVEEEYSLALTHRRQVVPVLIDDVEPPGFVAGRTWVDFRDPAQFANRVDDLVFGITGRRAAGTAPAAVPLFRDAVADRADTDEAAILRNLITRRKADERRLRHTRMTGGIIGVAVGGLSLIASGGVPPETRFLWLTIGLAVPSVAGWGVTARALSRLSLKLEQFEVMCDGLEACRSRSHPGCIKLRQHFWDLIVHTASEAGMHVGRA